jgi:hypothetical protein
MKYLLFILITTTVFIACTKNVSNITMIYEQTQCADKWGYGANDDETKEKLIQFLDSLRFAYSDIRFAKINPGAVCQACTCVTGGVFTLKTREAYVNQYIALGFTKK